MFPTGVLHAVVRYAMGGRGYTVLATNFVLATALTFLVISGLSKTKTEKRTLWKCRTTGMIHMYVSSY